MSDNAESAPSASTSKTKPKPKPKSKGKTAKAASGAQESSDHLKSTFGTAAPSTNKKKLDQPISSLPLPTSQLFVESLRKDVSTLLHLFSQSWSRASSILQTLPPQTQTDFEMNDEQKDAVSLISDGPLALFSDLWTQKGWNYIHFVVGEHDATRTAFYDVINRIFQEHLQPFNQSAEQSTAASSLQLPSHSQTEKLQAVGSLFGMYLLYSTQPPLNKIWTSIKEDHDSGVRPMHKIVIELDLYQIILQIPSLAESALTVSEPIANLIQSKTPSTSQTKESKDEFIQPIADVIQVLRNLCDELEPEEREELKNYLDPKDKPTENLMQVDGEGQRKVEAEAEDEIVVHDSNDRDQSDTALNQSTSKGKEKEIPEDAQWISLDETSSSSIKPRPKPEPKGRKSVKPSEKTNLATNTDLSVDPPDEAVKEPTAVVEPRRSRRSAQQPQADESLSSIDTSQINQGARTSGRTKGKRKAQELDEVVDDQADEDFLEEEVEDNQVEPPPKKKATKSKGKGKEKEQIHEDSSSALKTTSNPISTVPSRVARVEPVQREITPLDEFVQDSAFIIIPPTSFNTRSSIPDNSIQSRSQSDQDRGNFGKLVTTTETTVEQDIGSLLSYNSVPSNPDRFNKVVEVKERNLSRAELLRSVIRAKLGLTLEDEPTTVVLGTHEASTSSLTVNGNNQSNEVFPTLPSLPSMPPTTSTNSKTILKIPKFHPPYNSYEIQTRGALATESVNSNLESLETGLKLRRVANEESRNRSYRKKDFDEYDEDSMFDFPQASSSKTTGLGSKNLGNGNGNDPHRLQTHEELLQQARLKALESVRSAKTQIEKKAKENGNEKSGKEDDKGVGGSGSGSR